jgi:hypothetical protein
MIINYNFFHWGPFLYKTKIQDKELQKIKLLCKKDKRKDHRKNLAGLIRHEYKIDKEKLFLIISPYIESYAKASYEHYGLTFGKKLSLESCWVNFMTKYESNPLHSHTDDLSFVIFVKIPETLKKEMKQSINSTGDMGAPGVLNFIYSLTKNTHEISSHSFIPNECDFFIFPAFLGHYVNHFQSEGERISVSGNLKINYE